MAEQQAQTELVKPKSDDPVFILTDWAAVAVYGPDSVSKAELLLLSHCLKVPEFGLGKGEDDHNVRMVIFRTDGKPTDEKGTQLFAGCCPEANAIMINLQHTFVKSVEDSIEDDAVSAFASYYRNMGMNFLHEIQHLNYKLSGKANGSKPEEEEMEAEKWAEEKLRWIAKNHNIEPGHYSESSWFCSQMMAMIVDMADDEEWAQRQRWMMENHIMAHYAKEGEKEELTLNTFKSYIQALSEDHSDDSWKNPTLPHETGKESPLDMALRGMKEATQPIMEPTVVGGLESVAAQVAVLANESVQTGVSTTAPNVGGNVIQDDGFGEEPWEDDGFLGSEDGFEGQVMDSGAFSGVAGVATMLAGNAGQVNSGARAVAPVPAQTQTPPAPVQMFGGHTPVNVQTGVEADQHQAVVQSLPPTGFDPATTSAICRGVYEKIYAHIFTNCRQVFNSDIGFEYPEAVCNTPIQLTPQEIMVVVGGDCMDEMARFTENRSTVDGLLRGKIMKNTKLPGYVLYINDNGFLKKRLVLPQNPGKRGKDGNYSKTALQAKGGTKILYIMDDLADGQDKIKTKIVDNRWVD